MKTLLTVTFYSGLLTLVRMGSGFIIAKVLAVYAGPSGMALLGQVQSIVAVFSGVVNAPVGSGVVRYTAQYKERGAAGCAPWWKACIWWLVWILCMVMPAGILFARPLAQFLLHDATYAWIIWLLVCMLPLAALGTLINSVTNGYQQYPRYLALGAVSTLSVCVLMVALIMTQGINGALFAATTQASVASLILLTMTCWQPWFKWRYFWGKTATVYKTRAGGYLLMTMTSALATPITIMSVRNILVLYAGWDAAGQWQAVWKISEVYLGVITLSLSIYYLPKLATLHGLAAVRREINQTVVFFFPLVSLAALCIYGLRDNVIAILFTEAFLPARELFAIQLAGDVVKMVGWLYAYPMLSCGATRWFVATEVLSALVFVMLSWLLVPCFLAQGANLAYLMNYVLYFLATGFCLRFYVK